MIDVPGFVIAQLAGAAAGYLVSGWLTAEQEQSS
jgi:hypothetical protein